MVKFIAVAHGECEKILCERIFSFVRKDVCINTRESGSETIALWECGDYLKTGVFEDYKTLNNWYNRKKSFNKGRRVDLRNDELVIFVVMDVDNDRPSLKSFRTKNMFRDSLFYDSIMPIVSDPDLDEIFRRHGYNVPKSHKPEYYRNMLDEFESVEQLESVMDPELTQVNDMISKVKEHCPDYQ